MPNFAQSLLGIGTFCDADCTVAFTRRTVTVFNPTGKAILTGWRERNGAKLWRFSLCPNRQPKPSPSSCTASLQAFSAYDLPSVEALVKYLHASAGFPVKSTWLAAIKAGNYAS